MHFSLTKGVPARYCRKKTLFYILPVAFLFVFALYFRTSGLFRGLGDQGYIFHPDEAKQVLALFNFLGGEYVRYYGSLFYDGYPYGLNHLDEYLLRPLLFLFGPDRPDQHVLYGCARLLRVAYGMIIMGIGYHLVYRLVRDRTSALLALLLLALSPLAITVAHFATGDIGVDLFSALCFLFLLLYLDKPQKRTWLFCSGIAVGAAFSAKYNGLLVGMVPAMVLFFELLPARQLRLLVKRSCLLGAGAVLGAVLFTPNLLLDFKTTVGNMAANFAFIKNYNVPADILARPWLEKALLGFQANSLYILSSLGYTVCFACLAGLMIAAREYLAGIHSPDKQQQKHTIFLLSIALFPVFAFILSLSGKYVVQPFHFSYLLLPLIIVTSFLFSTLHRSKNVLLRGCSIILVLLAVIEFGRVSLHDNFFWRLEDNIYIEQNLPPSIYDREAFYTHRSDKIRSLFLEPPGDSVFRNARYTAKGPDARLWNTIKVAPLPQVANPIGKDWIFINGPTFPRNERMLVLSGANYGKTIKRYLVLPADAKIQAFGIRSGSYPTSVSISYGKTATVVKMDAHQQKTVVLEPQEWRVSGGRKPDEEKVFIIPLTITVPHNDIWLTLLTSEREVQLFNIFGGGQDGPLVLPEAIPAALEKEYFSALSRIRYLEHVPSWQVAAGKSIPMWGVALAAGRYRLIAEVDGLTEQSEISIEFEDARGKLHHGRRKKFQIKKGIQRIEYTFTKAFVPYQGRFVINGISGTCQMLRFKLFPDYRTIADDFANWRTSGIKPVWVSRYEKRDSSEVQP
ncbi:MAG TPA: phospholipid carrier-dependent glycosyltransferase [Desulfobulbus sp.]|nr:phospholipid carrier-dependent glycosyltransferase [Desulfobulbus sp.]